MKTLIATLMIIVSISLIAYGSSRVNPNVGDDPEVFVGQTLICVEEDTDFRVSMADTGKWHVKGCDCSCNKETKQEAPKKVGKRKACNQAGDAMSDLLQNWPEDLSAKQLCVVYYKAFDLYEDIVDKCGEKSRVKRAEREERKIRRWCAKGGHKS